MLLGMLSCSDDKTEDGNGPRPVILKAEVFTAENEAGTVWNGGQSIGVYMLKSGTSEVIGDHANLKFLADNRGSTGYLVPADNNPAYYPTDGTEVDFRVYYPYNENQMPYSIQTTVEVRMEVTDQLFRSNPCFRLSRWNCTVISRMQHLSPLPSARQPPVPSLTSSRVSLLAEPLRKEIL